MRIYCTIMRAEPQDNRGGCTMCNRRDSSLSNPNPYMLKMERFFILYLLQMSIAWTR